MVKYSWMGVGLVSVAHRPLFPLKHVKSVHGSDDHEKLGTPGAVDCRGDEDGEDSSPAKTRKI